MPGVRVRTENDRVPRLDGHDAFEEHRGSGVRNRREREDDPDRFSHFHQTAFRKLANDANGAFVLDVVVDELRGHHVLKGLVFHDPELGFLNRQAGQILRLFQSSQDHRLDDAIDVLLRELGKDGGGGSGLTDQSFQVSNPFFTEACTVLLVARGPDSIVHFARVHCCLPLRTYWGPYLRGSRSLLLLQAFGECSDRVC